VRRLIALLLTDNAYITCHAFIASDATFSAGVLWLFLVTGAAGVLLRPPMNNLHQTRHLLYLYQMYLAHYCLYLAYDNHYSHDAVLQTIHVFDYARRASLGLPSVNFVVPQYLRIYPYRRFHKLIVHNLLIVRRTGTHTHTLGWCNHSSLVLNTVNVSLHSIYLILGMFLRSAERQGIPVDNLWLPLDGHGSFLPTHSRPHYPLPYATTPGWIFHAAFTTNWIATHLATLLPRLVCYLPLPFIA